MPSTAAGNVVNGQYLYLNDLPHMVNSSDHQGKNTPPYLEKSSLHYQKGYMSGGLFCRATLMRG